TTAPPSSRIVSEKRALGADMLAISFNGGEQASSPDKESVAAALMLWIVHNKWKPKERPNHVLGN
ncbi:hypothetical protein ACC794_37675, partial [Rhizobium ruizarguesonis]